MPQSNVEIKITTSAELAAAKAAEDALKGVGAAAGGAGQKTDELQKGGKAAAEAIDTLGAATGPARQTLIGLQRASEGGIGGILGLGTAIKGLWNVISNSNPLAKLITLIAGLAIAIPEILKSFGLWEKMFGRTRDAAQEAGERIDAINKVKLDFANNQTALDKLIAKLDKAAASADRLKAANDKLADSRMALEINKLDLDRQKSLSGTTDEEKRKQINFSYDIKEQQVRQARAEQKSQQDLNSVLETIDKLNRERALLTADLKKAEARAKDAADTLRYAQYQAEGSEMTPELEKMIAEARATRGEVQARTAKITKRMDEIAAELAALQVEEEAARTKRGAVEQERVSDSMRTNRDYQEGRSPAERAAAIRAEAAKSLADQVKAIRASYDSRIKGSANAYDAQNLEAERDAKIADVSARVNAQRNKELAGVPPASKAAAAPAAQVTQHLDTIAANTGNLTQALISGLQKVSATQKQSLEKVSAGFDSHLQDLLKAFLAYASKNDDALAALAQAIADIPVNAEGIKKLAEQTRYHMGAPTQTELNIRARLDSTVPNELAKMKRKASQNFQVTKLNRD